MNYSRYKDIPTFSQRHGFREIPGPPQLEHISAQARNYLWGVLWSQMKGSTSDRFGRWLGDPWRNVLASVSQRLMGLPLDQFTPALASWQQICRSKLLSGKYHECFDFLEIIMRHPDCPGEFVQEITEVFQHQLAYRIDTTSLPTIIPAATKQEGDALLRALKDLGEAGLGGAAKHLREAGRRIIGRDWPGSVRESIHAVESVAKRIAPGNAGTLGKVLTVLEGRGGLHGALKAGFSSLYGYTSDEPGIRHALLRDESKVTQDEAIYMIGACAAFCSYLWRKFGCQDAASGTETHP